MDKLKQFLSNVYESNAFYKNIVTTHGITDPADINQYPILTREQLQCNKHSIFSDGFQSEYFLQKLRRQISSGTSGVPLSVYWNPQAYWRSILSLWRKRLLWYGIFPNDKYVRFTLQVLDEKRIKSGLFCEEGNGVLSVCRSFLQDSQTFLHLLDKIHEYAPVWILIQPFILSRLVDYYQYYEKMPPSRLKYIEVTGEMFTAELRQRAEKFFRIPIGNMYGSEEVNGIALECPYQSMHILEDNVFVEIDNTKNRGEVIVTNLHNTAMPLIRYAQGDIAEINNNLVICECGSLSPTITVLKGRMQNCVESNGVEINSYLLGETMTSVNNQFRDSVHQYKFRYYVAKKELCCYILIRREMMEWKESILTTILNELEKRIPSKAGVYLNVCEKSQINNYDRKFQILEIID